VERDAAAQPRDVGQIVGMLERLGQLGHDAQLIVDVHERVVEELVRLLRHLVHADPRIEIHRRVRRPHDDIAARVLAAAYAAARCESDNSQRHNSQRPTNAQRPTPKTFKEAK
jgi:hypothetical protein